MKTNKNIFFTSWPLFVTLLLTIGAALGQDASLPDPMPTITPTPTVNPLLRKLQTQLSFGFGGGCGDCGINECSTEALGNWNLRAAFLYRGGEHWVGTCHAHAATVRG